MLLPKKTKFRKMHRGRRRGESRGQTSVHFGEYGIKSLEDGWITNRQIEAARIAMTRKIRRGGEVWINIFPDKPYTKKAAGGEGWKHRLPGKAVHKEARRDPHGQGQGLAGGLGRRRQAGPRHV